MRTVHIIFMIVVLLMVSTPVPSDAMVKPMFGIIKRTGSGAATRFASVDNNATLTTSITAARQPISIPGRISDMVVDTSQTAPGAGTSYAIVLQKNGSDTALTCTISNTTTTGCSDHTDSVTVAAGDLVAWKITPTNTPATLVFDISSAFTGTNPAETNISAGGGTSNLSTTLVNYYPIGGFDSNPTTIEASSTVTVPTSGTLDTLYFQTSVSPGTGKSYTLALMKNDATTTLTCQVSSAQTQCPPDTTHSVSVVQGDTIAISIAPSGTPTAAVPSWSVRFKPSTDGEAPIWGISSLLQTGTRFIGMSGKFSVSINGGAATTTVPVDFNLRKLYFQGEVTYTGVNSRSVTARRNGVNTGLTTNMTSGTSGIDNANQASYSANDLIDWTSVTSGSPANNTFKFTISAVSYIPPIPPAANLSPSKFRIFGGSFSIRGGKIVFQ